MASLSVVDKERVRYHLGYGSTEPASSITFGQPALQQPLFLLESAMDRVLTEAIPRILRILGELDQIEERMSCGRERLAASSLSEITLRPDELAMLDDDYKRWAGRLADILRVPLYPFSNRFQPAFRVNTRVRG